MSDATLQQLRDQLDSVDTKIVKLLEERFQITDAVAVHKDMNNIPLTDPKRETELLQAIRDKIRHPILKENISEIYEKIFKLNKTARLFRKYKKLPFKKVGILGLGMIGGSIVKGLKMKQPDIEIYTVKRNSQDIEDAFAQGYINRTVSTLTDLVASVELVILATPIDTIIPLAEEISRIQTANKVLVIDVASVKEKITYEFEKLTSETVEFCGTHPMGGSEKMGFTNTQGMMFVKKPWIITPHAKNTKETLEKIEQFIQFLGSDVVNVTGDKHDDYVASVSHVVFLLSCYLFAFIAEKENKAMSLAGTGFESLTRLASGSPAMHTEIIVQNYDNIAVSLVALMEYIKSHNLAADSLLSFFTETKQKRDSFITSRSQ